MSSKDEQSIKVLASELLSVRDEKDRLEASLKRVNKRKQELEEQMLPQLMERTDIEKIQIAGIGTLYLQSVNRGHIRAEDKPMAFYWFREHDLGDLIKEDIHWKTLSGWIKERTEQGEPVPEWCNPQFLQVARLRREKNG